MTVAREVDLAVHSSRFWSKVDRTGECWEWKGSRHKNGYGHFSTGSGSIGSSQNWLAHRVSFALFFGYWPLNLVCHTCDNRSCCNPTHFFLGSQKENMEDMDAKGRRVNAAPVREAHGRAKLNWTQVKEIRSRATAGELHIHLAPLFGVSASLIDKIVAGVIWREVVST